MKVYRGTIERELPSGGLLKMQVEPKGGLITARMFISEERIGGLYFYPVDSAVFAEMIRTAGGQE